MDHCFTKVNSDNESHNIHNTFNGDDEDTLINSNICIKQEPSDPEDMEMDTEKHGLWLETGKIKNIKTVISTTENSVGEVSCDGNSCNEQMTIKSDEFCDQVTRVDKQREYKDCDARKVGTYDWCIKKENTYDIRVGTEEDRLNFTWLEVGKCEDIDQVTVKSDDLSNKPVFEDDHKEHEVMEVEKYENDIKEENDEDLLSDNKSFTEDLSTEFIHKDYPESSGVQLFICNICEFTAENKKTLRAHIKRKHKMSVDWYQCQLCQLKTKTKGDLKNHFKVMHDMNIIWHHCRHCKFETKYKYSLEAHSAYKHKIIHEKCRLQKSQCCDYNSVLTFRLKQHLKRKHAQKVEWHQCRQCLFKTDNEDTLARHVTCKHESPNECEGAEKCEPYQCRLCTFKTDKQYFLTRHFTKVHHKNPELYKCLLCDFKTEDKFRVTLHFKKNHPVSANVL